MSSALIWQIYARVGGNRVELVAATRYAEDAAAMVAAQGAGAVVKADGRTVWRETEDRSAAESYDLAAAAMHRMREAHRVQRNERAERLERYVRVSATGPETAP